MTNTEKTDTTDSLLAEPLGELLPCANCGETNWGIIAADSDHERRATMHRCRHCHHIGVRIDPKRKPWVNYYGAFDTGPGPFD